jgi:filamentous hemagglutinin
LAGTTAPFFLPLSSLGASTTGKIVIGGYNSLLAGTAAFGTTAVMSTGSSPELSGGIGVGTAAAGSFAQYAIPGPMGTSLGYLFQIVPGPMQAAIEKARAAGGEKQ